MEHEQPEREPDKIFADDNLPFPDSEDGERRSDEGDTEPMHVDDRANEARPDRNDYGQLGDKTR